jgi:hypothetical protein
MLPPSSRLFLHNSITRKITVRTVTALKASQPVSAIRSCQSIAWLTLLVNAVAGKTFGDKRVGRPTAASNTHKEKETEPNL